MGEPPVSDSVRGVFTSMIEPTPAGMRTRRLVCWSNRYRKMTMVLKHRHSTGEAEYTDRHHDNTWTGTGGKSEWLMFTTSERLFELVWKKYRSIVVHLMLTVWTVFVQHLLMLPLKLNSLCVNLPSLRIAPCTLRSFHKINWALVSFLWRKEFRHAMESCSSNEIACSDVAPTFPPLPPQT